MCRFFFLLMHYNHPLPLSFLAVVQFAAKRSQPVMNMVAALCDVLESDRNKSKMREYRRQTPVKDSMTREKEKLLLKTLREGFIRVVHILNEIVRISSTINLVPRYGEGASREKTQYSKEENSIRCDRRLCLGLGSCSIVSIGALETL